jgi:TolB-like protein
VSTRFASAFRLAGALVEPALGRITASRGIVHVEPRVMDVLVALARAAPDPVSRQALMVDVWGHACVTDDALTRCVSILRDSLGDDRAHPRFIETHYKHGYRLLPAVAFDADGARPHDARRARGQVSALSIAVLPFVNFATDRADEFLCDGFTDLLIAKLAATGELRVASRTSSMFYKHVHRRIGDIARELDVRYLVEGSLIRDRSSMQAVVQLIDAREDDHVWAHSYVREPVDGVGVLDEMARLACSAMIATLTRG